MATPLREALLTMNDEPNSVAQKVNEAFREHGCPFVFKSGARKGQKCGGEVDHDVLNGYCECSKVRSHGRESWADPYGSFIWGVINSIPEEERRAMDEAEEAALQATESVRLEKQSKDAAAELETRCKRNAEAEAAVLGVEAGEFHVRPDGAAPDGMTWSFRLGKWVEPRQLKKRARVEASDDTVTTVGKTDAK